MVSLGRSAFIPLLACAVVLIAEDRSALAGPHARGVLLPHLCPDIEYTYGEDYERRSDLRDCEQAVTSGMVDPDRAQIWYILADFTDSPGPVNLGGVRFGFEDFAASNIAFAEYAACSGYLELPSPGWPGPLEGTAIVYDPGRRNVLEEIYWFATYVYGPVSIELGPDRGWSHLGEVEEGAFTERTEGPVEPGDPGPEQDEIEDYGILGFGVEGYNPCSPLQPQEGACCVADECYLVTRDECEFLGGTYRGDHTRCFPNPCEKPPVPASWGKIKRHYR